jgi:hypothetical protein
MNYSTCHKAKPGFIWQTSLGIDDLRDGEIEPWQ